MVSFSVEFIYFKYGKWWIVIGDFGIFFIIIVNFYFFIILCLIYVLNCIILFIEKNVGNKLNWFVFNECFMVDYDIWRIYNIRISINCFFLESMKIRVKMFELWMNVCVDGWFKKK